jgi:Domain of unknown function (DUF4258)
VPPLTIALLRRLVRSRHYLVSIHAADELEDDGLFVLDLENIILSGQIVERQRDRATHELKVVIRGQSLHGSPCCAVAKVGPTGRAIIITVYVEG